MQVADCYIRVRYPRLGETEFEELRERLVGAATELAHSVKRSKALDFTLEEGTLRQRLLLIGGIALGAYNIVATYHDFRESAIEIIHDAESFSAAVIDRFHKLTGTTQTDELYRRTTSRDVNRLRRIVAAVDQVSTSHVAGTELSSIRQQVIHDLAGLARENPDDLEIAAIIAHLPKDPIPDLPTTPIEAIAFDDKERKWIREGMAYRKETLPPLLSTGREGTVAPRRRFHARVPIRR
jgi:hypothetical protein